MWWPRLQGVFLRGLAVVMGLSLVSDVAFAHEADPQHAYEKVYFQTVDGLIVTADLYRHPRPDSPVALLFHQAAWSRGEYREIAPRLVQLGFHALAVDQRSGAAINAVRNETAVRARGGGLPDSYVDALHDMRAAVSFVQARYPGSEVVLFGSSYSASLVFLLALETPVRAVVSFSPGEYFTRLGKPKNWVAEAARGLNCPVFIASTFDERFVLRRLYRAVLHADKVAYRPDWGGQHGARALWSRFVGYVGYWRALTAFLRQYAIEANPENLEQAALPR